ncbi:hypothetical protein DRO97_10005 [Archaeoglobales archaeon]|nr:MAG: hypothetical protein DRO97_10005 [Archaeoglobales archaeon]
MNLVEFIVLISLFGMMGIFIAKLINLLEAGKKYEPKYIFVTLTAAILLFGLNLTTAMTIDFNTQLNYNPLVYFIYLRFAYFLLILNFFMTVLELITAFNVFSTKQPLKRV